MKTKKLLFTAMILLSFASYTNITTAQTLDANGCRSFSGHSASFLPVNTENILTSKMQWDSIRPLTEINKVDTPDVYPYITPDGLRLYFAQGVAGGNTNLFYASRSNTDSLFGNPKLVDHDIVAGSLKGCWLTNDELELYYSLNDAIYYSNRPSLTDTFSLPVSVTLTGDFGGYICGPSLTPDKQELYFWGKTDFYGNDMYIFKYIMTDSLTYTLADTLDFDAGYAADIGQLSKDGLKYYLGLKSGGLVKLYQMDRPNTSAQFSNLTILNDVINDASALRNSTPSVTSDESILVWLRNIPGTWPNNDIYIAVSTSAGLTTYQDNIFDLVEVFPNPCNNNANVKFNLNHDGLVNFNLIDIFGRSVLKAQNNYASGLHQENLDLNDLSAGIYILKIEAGNSNRTVKLIKTN